MSLIRYNKNHMTPGIFNLLSDIFSDEFPTNAQRIMRENTVPAVNVKETDKEFKLEMAIPGVNKKDINISFDENVLTISSESKEEKQEEKDSIKRREFHYNSFERSFNMPEIADGQNIKAKYEDGVLFITIPKQEEKAKLKKMIEVA